MADMQQIQPVEKGMSSSLKEDPEEFAYTSENQSFSPTVKKEGLFQGLMPTCPQRYPQGPRLWALVSLLSLSLLLVTLEATIVGTSIVSITDELRGFDKSSWIVTAYLIPYIGLFIIYAKISDIFGRKCTIVVALALFIAFSGACGAAHTMTELIIFRTLQGAGASGMTALSQIIMFELVPPEKYAYYATIISIAFALSFLLGPILGGAINDSGHWRWVFLLNVPIAGVCFVGQGLLLPNGFPYHAESNGSEGSPREKLDRHDTVNARTWPQLVSNALQVKRLDVCGAVLLLVFTLFILLGLQDAGSQRPWSSAYVVCFLTFAGVCAVVFFLWERFLTARAKVCEPIFPWRLVRRTCLSVLLTSTFLGAPLMIVIFLLPQRFIIVNNMSALQAGIRLLPFTLITPIGAFFAVTGMKYKVSTTLLLLVGCAFQILGLALLATIPGTKEVHPALYGYEVIAGFGVGMNVNLLLLASPLMSEQQDRSISIAATTQFRYVGGAISLAIVSNILNTYMLHHLSTFLGVGHVGTLLQKSADISKYPDEIRDLIRQVFADAYSLQMKITVGITAVQVPCTLMGWHRRGRE